MQQKLAREKENYREEVNTNSNNETAINTMALQQQHQDG